MVLQTLPAVVMNDLLAILPFARASLPLYYPSLLKINCLHA